MRKRKFLSGWIVMAIAFVLPFKVTGQINKSLSYSKDSIRCTSVHRHGGVYEHVQLPNAFHSNDVGKPDLPVYYYHFFVPKGKKVSAVTFIANGQIELQLNSGLLPAQHAITSSSIGNDTTFDVPDNDIYSKDAYYPETQAKVFRSDFVDGDMQIITVEVFPMQYNPKSKKLQMATNGTLNLATSLTTKASLSGTMDGNSYVMTNLVKSMVENTQDVPAAVSAIPKKIQASNLKSVQASWSVPFYEYTVVTTKALKPAFTQFITWKRMKGLNAGVVCKEDILADQMAANGDTRSHIKDDAGKIKQYLMAAYTNNKNNRVPATYVLLGGDSATVPVRYGTGILDTWTTFDGTLVVDLHTPTDLYYSDLVGNWNVDGDQYYGEPLSGYILGNFHTGDSVNYGPEIFVGRLLCNSTQDILTWTTKQLIYEQNPGNGNNPNYLTNAYYTEADGFASGDYISGEETSYVYIPPFLANSGITNIHEEPSDSATQPTSPTGTSVISDLNSNNGHYFGFYSVSNHGNTLGIQLASKKINQGWIYGIKPLDSYDSEPNNGFDNLTNYNNPFIIYSAGCLNMPFDKYGIYQYPAGTRNIGEAFTVVSKGGGPAFLGYTRDAEIFFSTALENIFLHLISSSPQLSISEGQSKVGFPAHREVLGHNLLGDPEMQMWTGIPFNSFGPVSSSFNNKTVTVTISDTIADRICLISALNTGYDSVALNTKTAIFHNVSQPYYLTITKLNHTPTLIRYPVTNAYIQNDTLKNTAYLDWKSSSNYNILAGNNVDVTQTPGNVVIQSGANVTFDATGNILLSNGFQVQLGASFLAK